jgi:cysteine-rich repeat protein
VTRAALAAVVALAGCNSLLGIDDLRLTDAGGPADADLSPDAEVAPPNTVVGTSTLRYVLASGEVTEAEDLRSWQFQALVPDDNEPTGFRVIAGSGTQDGRFTIEGVPDGETYYLKVVGPNAQGAQFWVLQNHVIRLDRFIGGRPDSVTVSAEQPVDLNLTGMQPWQTGDWLAVEVYNLGTENWGVNEVFAAQPAAGATAIATRYDWGCADYCYSWRPDGKPALVDHQRGDVVELFHVRGARRTDTGGRRMQRVERTIDRVAVPSVTMASGIPTSIAGTFSPVALDQTARVTLNRGQFDAGHDDQNRIIPFRPPSTYTWAAPVAHRGILIGPPMFGVAFDDWSGAAPTTSSVDVTYGDPYPAEMDRVLYQEVVRQRRIRLPGRTPRGLGFGYRRVEPLVLPVPATPNIQPPGNLRIDGIPATLGGRVTFDGQTPVRLTWNAVATAGAYGVEVVRIFASGSATDLSTVASFKTWQNALDIPAEVFGGGEFFAFRVTAYRGDISDTFLLLWPGAETSVQAVTGMFRLSANCGNGVIDANEQCDPGAAETPTCDIDCTPAECGDSTVNLAAGEACDTGFNTVGCDADCTRPVCGDGWWNPETEDCDDGNTLDDGNGCDANCRANNQCGDGVVQDAIEECDDGNRDPGDGCDERCLFE